MKVLIAGLARSGTSTLFATLQEVMSSNHWRCRYVYEPYLWHPDVFNGLYKNYGDKFRFTDSLHPDGISVHCNTPIFSFEPSDKHDAFVKNVVFPDNHTATLAKAIRANGRLSDYLRLLPDLRILLLVRNPIDTINSASGLFSLFGDEFHPSDKPRFFSELQQRFHVKYRFDEDADEVQLSSHWWRHLTEQALLISRMHPDRVLAVPYEAYVQNKLLCLRKISDFLHLRLPDSISEIVEKSSGPVTGKRNLSDGDVRKLHLVDELYWENFIHLCAEFEYFLPDQARERVTKKYENANGKPRYKSLRANLTSLNVRNSLDKDINALNSDHLSIVSELRGDVSALERENQTLKKAVSHQKGRLDAFSKLSKENDNLVFRTLEEHKVREAAKNQLLSLKRSRILRLLGPLTQKVRKSISSLETQLSSRFTPVDITCVITSYNNADTLRRAITSVLAQEPPIKKIIIADDGSEDGSRDLIRSIARDHPQISAAFRDRNLGPSLNRHLALLEASTPFITQLDGDDAFAATKILAETKALEGDLNAIAFSDILIEKTDGENHFVNTEVFEQISSKSDRVWHLATRASPPPRDMLLSKQTYLAAGGYSSAIGIYEDWDLKIRLASLVDNWRHSGAVGTKYLRSGTGLSSINATRHAYWLTRVISKNITSILAARDDRSLHELADVISRHTSKLSSAQYLLNTIDYFDHGFISDIDLRSKFEAFDYRAPSNPTANEIDSRFQVFRTPKPADYPRDNGPEREHNKQPIAVLTKTSFIHHGDTQV